MFTLIYFHLNIITNIILNDNMKNEHLVKGLQLNKISEKNIELCLQLKELGEKLGFEMSDYDAIDEDFLITFSIKLDLVFGGNESLVIYKC